MSHVEVLLASGMEGSDLETSLRTFVIRSGRPESEIRDTVRGLREATDGLSLRDRDRFFAEMFGSDAVRVASALVARLDE